MPVAEKRLPAGQCRERRRIGAQDARPQTHESNKSQIAEDVKLGAREAALWTGEDGEGLRCPLGGDEHLGQRPPAAGLVGD